MMINVLRFQTIISYFLSVHNFLQKEFFSIRKNKSSLEIFENMVLNMVIVSIITFNQSKSFIKKFLNNIF